MSNVRTASLLVSFGLLVAAPCFGGEVTGFMLVDARTNRDIGPLKDGATVDRTKVGGAVSLRADVTDDVRSVRFAFDGQVVRTESTAPFSVAGGAAARSLHLPS